jgi:multicomponent Na+:H+ antiporter subunit B
MRSLILSTAARYLLPLLLIFSVFVLLRGHNEPGGGFVGGLVAASAFALYALALGVESAEIALQYSPRRFIGFGLLLAVASGMFPMLRGYPFMKALWSTRALPAIGKLGTPLFFDIGVYLVVIGVVLIIVFTLFEGENE